MTRTIRLAAQTSALALALAAMPAVAQTQPSATVPVSPPSGGQSSPDSGTQAPVSTDSTTGEADQANTDGFQDGDIIVTANKRSQSITDVGLTIQAADAAVLADRGIGSPADLAKLVPGFTFTQSLYSTPVFTLRGIGLYDATFGASPSVSVYTDQIPRNVPVMSAALDLDLERIEVLKGPQGTLFGQSSTGGAINYIIAKPTDTPQYGFDLSYERFDRKQFSTFVSTPLSDTVRARGAIRVTRGGAYQYSISRRDDENGAARLFESRLTVDWQPAPNLKLEATGTYVADNSDVQAPQYLGTPLNVYSAAALAAANASPATRNPFAIVDDALYAGITTPGSPNFDASFLGRQATAVARLNGAAGPAFQAGAQALLGTRVGGSNRQAEWTEGFLNGSDNEYYQGALRGDYTIGSQITLTSITAFARQRLDYEQDLDATTASVVDVPIFGSVATFNQELRIAGEMPGFNWIVGGSYDNIRSNQTNFFVLTDYSGNAPLGLTGPLIQLTRNDFSSKLKTYAGFANAELEVGDSFTIIGGIRYTKNKQDASYCYNDPAGAGAATVFSIFNDLFTGTDLPPILAGECFPLGDGLNGTTFGVSTRDPVVRSLDEDNFSFRAGANYKLAGGGLIYGTVSQGYKTGIFSAIGASSVLQYAEATQEKVIAYEAGIKLPLADRRFNINAAGFYYDYSDKQVRGRVNDAIFGLLEKLINVPESYVYGFEADVLVRPFDGLTLSASGTYLKSKVTSDFTETPDGSAVFNAQGYTGNFKGSELPYTPKWSANADIQYQFQGESYRPFVGGNLLYQGKQNATFANDTLIADDFEIDDYVTLDVRAGVESADGRWKVSAFGRNVTNKTYTTSISTFLDTLLRYTGRPATYGVSLSVRY